MDGPPLICWFYRRFQIRLFIWFSLSLSSLPVQCLSSYSLILCAFLAGSNLEAKGQHLLVLHHHHYSYGWKTAHMHTIKIHLIAPSCPCCCFCLQALVCVCVFVSVRAGEMVKRLNIFIYTYKIWEIIQLSAWDTNKTRENKTKSLHDSLSYSHQQLSLLAPTKLWMTANGSNCSRRCVLKSFVLSIVVVVVLYMLTLHHNNNNNKNNCQILNQVYLIKWRRTLTQTFTHTLTVLFEENIISCLHIRTHSICLWKHSLSPATISNPPFIEFTHILNRQSFKLLATRTHYWVC